MRTLLPFGLLLLAQPVLALSVSIEMNAPAVCTYATGSVYANASGGLPPYTYLWNDGSTTYGLDDLVAGTYAVTVTDDEGTQASAEYTLFSTPPEATVSGFQFCPDGVNGPPFRMLGQASIWNVGMPPITMQDANYVAGILTGGEEWERAIYFGTQGQLPAPGTWLQLPFTDSNGCPGTMDVTIPMPFAYPIPQVLTVDGACSDGNNGGVLVHVPAAANPQPNYVKLFHNGLSYGDLEEQYSWGQMFGQVPKTIQRHDLAPGDWALVVSSRLVEPYAWLTDAYFPNDCADTTFFTVPDLGYTCGTLTGMTYLDDNQNCSAQYNEPRVPEAVIEIQPGGYFTLTNSTGGYHQNLPYGSYTVQQQSTELAEHCEGAPQPFTLSTGMLTATKNFPDTALTPRDVMIQMASSFARPGFEMAYGITVRNLTAGVTGNMTLSMTFDPALSYVSSNPTATSVVGNTITWNTTQLTSFTHRDLHVRMQVPADVSLVGTDLLASASVTIAQEEPNLTNNSVTNTRTVTASLDPNAKEATTSTGASDELYLIDQDEWLDYTIQFQNTGTDTAFFVVITDTLPETLDPSSFLMGVRSHPGSVEMGDHGTLRFIFPNILLPDSNANEAASHGFVSFRIKPYEPVLPGTEIENNANIYFDFNPPVITEPSVLVAEFSTWVDEANAAQPALHIFPNPANGTLMVEWDGTQTGTIRILAMDGRVVHAQRGTGALVVLDVSQLQSGPYLIEAIDGSGTRRVSRFVRQ